MAKKDDNLKYYIEHQSELVEKYNGRYIIISAEKFQGVYSSLKDAVIAARKKFKPGEFQIQLVEPGEGSYTKIISRSRLYA